MSNRRQNPSPAEKNKWLEGTSCFCLSVLPVSPGRGFMAHTVCVWGGGGQAGKEDERVGFENEKDEECGKENGHREN